MIFLRKDKNQIIDNDIDIIISLKFHWQMEIEKMLSCYHSYHGSIFGCLAKCNSLSFVKNMRTFASNQACVNFDVHKMCVCLLDAFMRLMRIHSMRTHSFNHSIIHNKTIIRMDRFETNHNSNACCVFHNSCITRNFLARSTITCFGNPQTFSTWMSRS